MHPKDSSMEAELRAFMQSDGTLGFHRYGELLHQFHLDWSEEEKRPYLVCDADCTPEKVAEFIQEHDIKILNVSGSGAWPWGDEYEFLARVFELALEPAPTVKSAAKT